MQWRAEPVAQSVEHVTFNHGVAGSSPAGLTNKNNNLGEKSALFLPEQPVWEDHGKKSTKHRQHSV
jgi:hypothetical protein